MKTTRPLISLLVLATVLVDCVAYSLALRDPPSVWTYLPVLALQRSQVTLMALWLVWGSGRLALRLTCTALAVGLWSGLLAALGEMPTPGEMGAALMTQVVVVSVPFVLALVLRRMRKPFVVEGACLSASGLGRWQFSIAQMLGWITALAILLAILKSLGLDDAGAWQIVAGEPVALFLLRRTLIALAASWAVLGSGSPIGRASVLAGVFVMLLVLRPPIPPGAGGLVNWSASILATETLLLVGSLVVIRVAGYRRLDG